MSIAQRDDFFGRGADAVVGALRRRCPVLDNELCVTELIEIKRVCSGDSVERDVGAV